MHQRDHLGAIHFLAPVNDVRRFRVIFLSLLAVTALAGAFAFFHSSEPTYQGRRLSVWLDELARPQSDNETPASAFNRQAELTNVVRAIGPKALPFYLDWITGSARGTSPYEKAADLFSKFSGKRINLPERQVRTVKAVLAIQILASNAAPALPTLEQLLHVESSCGPAGRCLVAIGAESVPVLVTALTNATNERVRYAAAEALGDLGTTAMPAKAVLLEQLRKHPSQAPLGISTADVVVRALVEMEPTIHELVPFFVAELISTNAAVGAAYGLARIGTSGTVPLLHGLTNENTRIRCAAEAAFALREFMGTEQAANSPLFHHFNAAFNNRFLLATMSPFGDAERRTIEVIAKAEMNNTDRSARWAASNVLAYVWMKSQTNAPR